MNLDFQRKISKKIMKKIIQKLLLFFALFFMNFVIGQNQSGQITYIGSLTQKYIDSAMIDIKTKKEWSMSLKQTYAEFIKNAKDIELILKFKKNESYYYGIQNLEMENGYNLTEGKISITPFYTNNSLNNIIEINNRVGNISHKSLKWEVTEKTKKIGKYLCYQAIATEELYSRKGFFYNEKVIAWFAPKIPLNYGPKYYKGLPGLILEINKKEYSIIASKISLNPTKEVKFKVPKIENVISREESYKRYKEMIEERKKN